MHLRLLVRWSESERDDMQLHVGHVALFAQHLQSSLIIEDCSL